MSHLLADGPLTLYQVLTGDMLLAAAFVSYAGPFTSRFRSSLITNWIKFIVDKGAPMTPGITDPLKVRATNA
jgi:dynein heavy chain, axonemal